MNNSIVWQIILQILLIALNAIFACAEIAVISVNESKLNKLASEKNRGAQRLIKLTSQPARFLSTIQVAITLSGFLGSAFAADNFSEILVRAVLKTGLPVSESVLNSVSVIVITLILSYFTIIFGELVPKRIAMKNSEKLALAISGLISFISTIFAPIVWVLTKSTNGVLRLIGIDPNAEDETVTEEDIMLMADDGSKKGTIDEDDNRIIKNIFRFDDLTAGDICTHRKETVVLWAEDDPEEWKKIVYESNHSNFPVCGESIDSIIGVLNIKNYLKLTDRSKENVMNNAVQEPYFVYENMKADDLFDKMRNQKDHFAVVLDEYGGMCGVITITDLLEQIVGEFNDDTSDKTASIENMDSATWSISGSCTIEEVEEHLGISLKNDKYDTFNGFIIGELGEIPKDGSRIDFKSGRLEIFVTEVKDHFIERAVVRISDKAADGESCEAVNPA